MWAYVGTGSCLLFGLGFLSILEVQSRRLTSDVCTLVVSFDKRGSFDFASPASFFPLPFWGGKWRMFLTLAGLGFWFTGLVLEVIVGGTGFMPRRLSRHQLIRAGVSLGRAGVTLSVCLVVYCYCTLQAALGRIGFVQFSLVILSFSSGYSVWILCCSFKLCLRQDTGKFASFAGIKMACS